MDRKIPISFDLKKIGGKALHRTVVSTVQNTKTRQGTTQTTLVHI